MSTHRAFHVAAWDHADTEKARFRGDGWRTSWERIEYSTSDLSHSPTDEPDPAAEVKRNLFTIE